MRKQERVVCFSVFLVVVYTSWIVAIAEERALPYVLTLPIAVGALVVAFKRPKLQLSSLPANILGLLAFALAGAELLVGSIEARLVSGAHLMAYLTWIVLWQKKQLTQYWWLFALSVIQVAIGSILMSTALYGVFLLGFLLLSVWTLAILSVYRSQLRFAPLPADSPEAAEDDVRPAAGTPRVSQATGSIQVESGRWLTARFIWGVMGIGLASSILGMVFFVFVPRQWIGDVAWGSDGDRSGALPGFGEAVKLGSFGTLLESRERVMEVRMFDDKDRPLEVEAYSGALGFDSPLFRGTVLEHYEEGRWTKRTGRGRTGQLNRVKMPGSIRQEYRLKPVGSRVLFAIHHNPLRRLNGGSASGDNPHIGVNRITGVLRYDHRRESVGVVEYRIYSLPARTSRGHLDSFPSNINRMIFNAELRNALKEIAERDIGVTDADTPRAKARKIVTYLRESGRFDYTTRLPRRQYPQLDPVVEFLQHSRQGHCEYFATALGLLLRAVQVPSRLVWGFKGGAYNELSGYWEVEQRHAHAWVEAHLEGAWVTLDATPAAREDVIEQGDGLFRSWLELKNYFSSLWSRFVVNISLADQRRQFYSPLKATAEDAWNSVSQEREKSASGLQALLEFLANPSRWFSWQGGLLSFLLMLTVASIYWSARKALGLLRNLSRELAAAHRHRIQVAFYERFHRLCEALGLHRRPSQTQREFAAEVAGRLSALPAAAGIAAFPEQLTTNFYEVRFGGRELSEEQLLELDRLLTEFEQRLPDENGRPARGNAA